MRIVFLNPAGMIGGAERVLLAAVRAVRTHMTGTEPVVVLLADGPLRTAAEEAGATVKVVPLPGPLAAAGDTQLRGAGRVSTLLGLSQVAASSALPSIGFLRQLRITLHRLRPHLIHSNGLKTHLLARVAGPSGVPILWHVHDFYSERPLMARLLKRVTHGVTGAVAISDAVAKDFHTTVPGVPSHVVRNGVDTDHFSPAEVDGRGLDRLAGLPPAEGMVRVGLVATYARWKGQEAFLEAMSRLPGEFPVRGYVVGGPIYSTAGSQWTLSGLKEKVEALGLTDRIGFVPFQADPADVYRMLDVVVHASTRPEPFGLTIAEGMSCGRAVVVSAAGGAVELFQDGENGLGHPHGDIVALTGLIRRLVIDPDLRSRLGHAAREMAVQMFSIDQFAAELTAEFRRTMVCRR